MNQIWRSAIGRWNMTSGTQWTSCADGTERDNAAKAMVRVNVAVLMVRYHGARRASLRPPVGQTMAGRQTYRVDQERGQVEATVTCSDGRAPIACGSTWVTDVGKPHLRLGNADNRRGGDSNPRCGKPHTGFRNQPLQPLGHLSIHRRAGERTPDAFRCRSSASVDCALRRAAHRRGGAECSPSARRSARAQVGFR